MPASTPFSVSESAPSVGGEPVISLNQADNGNKNKAQFVSVDILPGRGMNIFQIRARLPEKGLVNLLASPSIEEFKIAPEDSFRNRNFMAGAAILLPWANRIRGNLDAENRVVRAKISGQEMPLPANWKGKRPGAETLSIHGLLYPKKFAQLEKEATNSAATLTARLNAGNFDGHWPSQTEVTVIARLEAKKFTLTIHARNAGDEALPMGIGWHPYFAIPSERRDQALLRIPAHSRLEINNYDDVLPTGKLLLVEHSPYDFNENGGRKLGKIFLDDGFTQLSHYGGLPVAELHDPASNYGLRVRALSPEIKTFQVYAPTDKAFVAIEPQYNLTNPFGDEWKALKPEARGMVTLAPGESTTYTVELELVTE